MKHRFGCCGAWHQWRVFVPAWCAHSSLQVRKATHPPVYALRLFQQSHWKHCSCLFSGVWVISHTFSNHKALPQCLWHKVLCCHRHVPAGCCSPPQQWLHFSSVYACKTLWLPLGRGKTINILNIFLFFRSKQDTQWKHIPCRHHEEGSFQALPSARCGWLWDDFLPQIAGIRFVAHTGIANHCISRHFPQKLSLSHGSCLVRCTEETGTDLMVLPKETKAACSWHEAQKQNLCSNLWLLPLIRAIQPP